MRSRMVDPEADYEDTDSLNQSSVSRKRDTKRDAKQVPSAFNIIVNENTSNISPVK